MAVRLGLVAAFLGTILGVGGTAEAVLKPSPERPDIVEIDDPILIGREVLQREMELNVNLEEFIDLYGWPDYAEVQEVQVQEPFAAYEVRIYYLRRDRYLAFGRVAVAPSISDYGVRKYEGPIRPETLDRLLTAVVPDDRHADDARYEEMSAAPMVEAPVDAPVESMVVVESPDEEVVAVVDEAPEQPAGDIHMIVTRLEAAADRAALAANMAERASNAATASADRAAVTMERVVENLGQ